MITRQDWIRAFGGRVVCPDCGVDFVNKYTDGWHKPDCKVAQFNARMKLLKDAP